MLCSNKFEYVFIRNFFNSFYFGGTCYNSFIVIVFKLKICVDSNFSVLSNLSKQ